MHKIRRSVFLSAEFFVLIWVLGCASLITPTEDVMQVPTSEPNSDERLTEIVADILTSPDQYVGQSVEVVGYYRGWNLLQEIQEAPPVTRSDWVIADSSGAIYVTGLRPTGLDPSSSKDTWTLVRLSAQVKNDEEKEVVYLQGETIEILSK